METIPASTKYYGCDIGKATIVIAPGDGNQPLQNIANHHKAITGWLSRLPKDSVIGMEATGRYHEMLANCAAHGGHKVFVINPKHLSLYAKGLGQRGKTDPLDARVIARYLVREADRLHPYTEPTKAQRALRDLLTQRANIVKHGQAMRRCLQDTASVASTALTRATNAVLKGIERLIKQIDLQLQIVVREDAALEEKRVLLQTISGIGLLNGIALMHRFDRTPFANSDAVVAAYGLDPRPKDSGSKTGKRQLTKQGNAEDRRLIYLAAQSAARTRTFKPRYAELLAKGFATTEAVIIIARKLLRIAFAVWRSGNAFNPEEVRSKGHSAPASCQGRAQPGEANP